MSLKTDSEKQAQRQAEKDWDDLVRSWEAKLAGDYKLAERKFNEARNLARRMGFDYKSPAEIADMPREQLIERAEKAAKGEAEAGAALEATFAKSVLARTVRLTLIGLDGKSIP